MEGTHPRPLRDYRFEGPLLARHGRTMPDNVGERAATWDDDPGTLECARAAADAIRAAVAPERSTRLLEYGSGTGLTSQGLAGDVGPITLAAPSAVPGDLHGGHLAGA